MASVSTDLNLRVRRESKAIPEGDFDKLSSEAAAVRYCIDNSRLQDKTVAIEIGTDAGTLSKAKAGQARLNEESLDRLADATGFEAVLFAHCIRRGFDPRSLRRFESDIERENRELREQMAAMEAERQIERKTIRDLFPGAGR